MWIKWKYNDHGWPDFKELEIPDDFDGCDSIEDYLCERGYVPIGIKRFLSSKIKWEKIDLTSQEIKARKITSLRSEIDYHTMCLADYKKELEELLRDDVKTT